ncbi:hypothetical protein [Secundilactobacillus silagei]|uniref:Cell surface protein n=1 Tax=Secundilactobacillus silagei JCM 19001 TaxID=1302250 RepID=A0A1Z5H4K7_9LACO|nr:hypothetical protein [Secundilactobacillus silagei]TDG70379.1 hypothetical protein C5L25_001569 [Secundilactobacillus silagei JCM 19001]GAT17849.1 hypothetical protein IWT126_00106 [Secundilactobacillus silagei JCM 19001]
MKKLGTKLLVALTVVLGGLVASQQPVTAHAATTFSSSIIPSGHFQNAANHYAFHWQSFKAGKSKGQVLIFGNFNGDVKHPAIQFGVPTKYKLSKNRRTLTTYYRLTSAKGKLSSTYRMDLYKYSNSNYRVKLNQYKAGLLPSYKGSSYTFNLTKNSPAQAFSAFTTTQLTNYGIAQDTQSVQKQREQGETSADPNSSEVQQQIRDTVTKQVTPVVSSMVEAYNTTH